MGSTWADDGSRHTGQPDTERISALAAALRDLAVAKSATIERMIAGTRRLAVALPELAAAFRRRPAAPRPSFARLRRERRARRRAMLRSMRQAERRRRDERAFARATARVPVPVYATVPRPRR